MTRLVARVAIFLQVFLLTGSIGQEIVTEDDLGDLLEYKNKNRVIVTFTQSENDLQLQALEGQIEAKQCEYDNRKLVHVHREAEEGNFRLYVVGKDGKVKIEGKGIPPNAIRFYGREGLSQTFGKILDNLFEEIDTLPIRKREIRLDKDCSPPEEEEEIEE